MEQALQVSERDGEKVVDLTIGELKAWARKILRQDFKTWEAEDLTAALSGVERAIYENSPGRMPRVPGGMPGASGAKMRPTILIADDDPFTLAVLEDTFESTYSVVQANDGPGALELALDTRPDVILLDVMMPQLNGYQVCRCLKEQPETREIPVLFLTGLGYADAESTGLELGAVDYITKPLNPEVVRARVNIHARLKGEFDQLKLVAEMEHMLRSDIMGDMEFKMIA